MSGGGWYLPYLLAIPFVVGLFCVLLLQRIVLSVVALLVSDTTMVQSVARGLFKNALALHQRAKISYLKV